MGNVHIVPIDVLALCAFGIGIDQQTARANKLLMAVDSTNT
jgi:hypothetical protein